MQHTTTNVFTVGKNIKKRLFEECPNLSYAQAVLNTERSVDAIRNVSIKDQNDENNDCSSTLEQI